jgi:hypothetical protein
LRRTGNDAKLTGSGHLKKETRMNSQSGSKYSTGFLGFGTTSLQET